VQEESPLDVAYLCGKDALTTYVLRDTIKWTIHLMYSIYGMHLKKYKYKYLSHMKQYYFMNA
jgi:hypothetical protein